MPFAAHHHEVEQESVEAVIAESADAISGARPGARREDLEAYIKRIRTLEDMATAFKGVSQAYAIQAGREVRIIVKPEEIDDLEATRLARVTLPRRSRKPCSIPVRSGSRSSVRRVPWITPSRNYRNKGYFCLAISPIESIVTTEKSAGLSHGTACTFFYLLRYEQPAVIERAF